MKNPDSINQINYELVLVTGDIYIPKRIESLNEELKKVLKLKKFQHILCTGNVGNIETLHFLKSLCSNSSNFHLVKGDQEDEEILKNYNNLPETKVLKIGEFNIAVINGYQLVPWSDIETLNSAQKQSGCDILVSGYTHKQEILQLEGKYFINPGSLTGAYSPLVNDPPAGFMVLLISGDLCYLYSYEFNPTIKNFEVKKTEINKNKLES
jgi:vacuolar protein sorting-associated protein 29